MTTRIDTRFAELKKQDRAAFALEFGEAGVDAGGHDFFPRKISATCGMSLSPRPERLTTIR